MTETPIAPRESAASVGRRAEAAALRFLGDRGLREVARNFRCRMGEIDLVMRDDDCLVFVEVRYRRSERFGGAVESVSASKRRRLCLAARYYLLAHPEQARGAARFDIVAVAPDGARFAIRWIANAFECHE